MSIIVLAGMTALLSGSAWGDIVIDGSVYPVYGGMGDSWVITNEEEMVVGMEADGSLDITNGSDVQVTGTPVFIGDYVAGFEDTTGTVLLTGPGSTWTIDGDLTIGPLAQGFLNVESGAQLTTGDVLIGGSPVENDSNEVIDIVAGAGTVVVSGGSQWDLGDWGWLTVAGAGTGDLTISTGGVVTGDTSEIGLAPDSVGNVVVDDPDSTLTLTNDIVVGVWGRGTLTISDGGQVQSGRGWIGGADAALLGDDDEPVFESFGAQTGDGEVVVTGSNAAWDVNDSLVVGAWGTGDLTIESEGQVTAGEVYVGGMPMAIPEGQEFSRDMLADGEGTMTVTSGGTLTVTSDHTLFVGYSGTGTLNVDSGGDVVSPAVVIGGAPDANGTIVVSGTGSTLSAEYEIDVGVWGTGHLTVSDQGAVSTGNLLIGGLDSSDINDLPQEMLDDFGEAAGTGTVTVGGGGTVDVSRTTYVGNYGLGTLNVNEGGQVTSGEIAVGVAPGSHGIVNITGPNSHLATDANAGSEGPGYRPGTLIVGGYGQGEVTVSGGGELTVDNVLYVGGYKASELDFNSASVGHDPDGTGTVTVTGTGSTLSADILAIGAGGQGTVNVLDGATATTRVTMIGMLPDARGAMVVDNSGDTWTNTGSAVVGGYGDGSVTVSNGGHASIGEILYVGGFDAEAFDFNTAPYGHEPSGTGTVTVTGPESLLEAYGIGVGIAGNGTLEIFNGGRVEGQIVGVGIESGSTGSVVVDGEGSTLHLSGNGPLPDELTTQGEGSVVISNGGVVDVAGPNAVLAVGGDTIVGSEGEGTMTVSTGAVTTKGLYIGGSYLGEAQPGVVSAQDGVAPATGTVTVTGPDSSLDVTGDFPLIVGYSGTGTLNVNDDGHVTTGSMVIGAGPAVTGTVAVDAGHVAANSNIIVGAWGNGNMTIANGGDVTASEVFIGGFDESNAPPELVEQFGDALGTGHVTVTGDGSSLEIMGDSSLYVGYAGNGTLDVNEGAQVNAESMVVGGGPGVTGTVTVHDANSTLSVTNGTVVGAWGQGHVTVSEGGSVTTGGLYIGGFNAEGAGVDPALLEELGEPDGTGTVTVTGAGSSLRVTGRDTLVVGAGGTGHLVVSDGADVNSTESFIGGYLTFDYNDTTQMEDAHIHGGTGDALVTGAGSTWRNDVLVVGTGGSGTLDVTSGGHVSSYLGAVGFGPDASGRVTVSGPNSVWTNAAGDASEGDPYNGTLIVGGWGNGDLMVSNGGRVNAITAYIGGFDLAELGGGETPTNWGPNVPVGPGTVTVTGQNSLLQILGGNTTYVGFTGDGTLNILNGGRVISDAAIVGTLEDSNGVVNVDGAGSTWSIVGGGGADASLDATGQGEVLLSNGGRLEASGDDAVLAVGDGISVGSAGQGRMVLSNGAVVMSEAGVVGGYDPQYDSIEDYFAPDAELGTGTGTVVISGSGTTWEADNLYVGFSGSGTVDVNDQGKLMSYRAFMGVTPDSAGTATVTGSGSRWESAEVLGVGLWGQGNLTVSDGAQVDSGEIYIGGAPFDEIEQWHQHVHAGGGGSGGIGVGAFQADGEHDPNLIPRGTGNVTVTGEGSLLRTLGLESLYVGYSGNGTLDVNEGGRVESNTAGIGAMPGSTGVVTVDGGTPSRWDNSASMFVGGYGNGSLTIRDGGVVDVVDTVYVGGFDPDQFSIDTEAVGHDPNGTGTVIVTGAGSTLWGSGLRRLYVGYSGNGTLDVNEGGYVESAEAGIGAMPLSTGEVTVHGTAPGGDDLTPGAVARSDGATRSTWESQSSVFVGGYGSGSLAVTDGGRVNIGNSLYIGGFDPDKFTIDTEPIGHEPNGTGTVAVAGTGSSLSAPTDLYVGYTGNGTLQVEDGAHVAIGDGTGNAYIGWGDHSTGAMTVTGEGSQLVVAGMLHVGHNGTGTLDVNDGATVTSHEGYIGSGENSSGAATVRGEGSRWTTSDYLIVGWSGHGTLTVSGGGRVNSDKGYIGYANSGNGSVQVTGNDSIWNVDHDLFVGGREGTAAGTGLLNVRDGGEVRANELTVWSTGTLSGNGTVTVTEPTTLDNYGTISPGNSIGTLTVNGNVVFHEGSTYRVEVSNTTSDKMDVNGDVDIQGGTVKVSSQGTILGQHDYEIIAADAVTGEFDVLDTALLHFSFTDANLGYDPNSVWLHLRAANFNDPNITRTYNQKQVAGALQTIAGQDTHNPVTGALQQLPEPGNLRHSYDQLSGQTRPALGPLTTIGTSRFLGTVTSRLQTVQGGLADTFSNFGLLAMAGPDSTLDGGRTYDTNPQGQTFGIGKGTSTLADMAWGLWGRTYGLYGDRETEVEAPGYNYSTFGGSVGLDYQFTDVLLGGLVVGMSEGNVDFAGSRDNTDFNAKYVGLYGSAAWEKWYLDAVGTIARLEYDTQRFVDLLGERLSGSFSGYELSAYAELGRNWQLAPDLLLQPLASVQYSYLTLDDYTEYGGVSALSFDTQTHESIKGSLGARLTRDLIETAGDFQAKVQLRGRWVHEFGDNHANVDSSFANDPTVVFNVRDNEVDRDSAVLGVGLFGDLNKHTRVYVDYDTRFNSDESIHVLSGSLQYRW